MPQPTEAIDAQTVRAMAAQLFNRGWELMNDGNRSPSNDRQLLDAVFGSRYHWSQVGDARNHAMADWFVARALTVVGRIEMAQDYADLALRGAVDNNLGPFMVGCGHEISARVAQAHGNHEVKDHHLTKADTLLSMIDNHQELEALLADLDSLR